MRRLWRCIIGWLLPGSALVLYAAILSCYVKRWDAVAAVTVFPFWMWGLLGFGMAGFSWLLARHRWAGAVTLLWLVTILAYSDESGPLLRKVRSDDSTVAAAPAPAPEGAAVLRVITFNCRGGYFNSLAPLEVTPWKPDVVLFQETSPLPVLLRLAQDLYPGPPMEHTAGGLECGIVTRGKILRTVSGKRQSAIISAIAFPEGWKLHVAGLHLRGAETDVRLYRPSTYQKHAQNRRLRRQELEVILGLPSWHRMRPPDLYAGDFNAPAGDPIFHQLQTEGYADAVESAGIGWPDTYPNAAPVLRIDHQWHGPGLRPLRAFTVPSRHSDHRMLVVDFALLPSLRRNAK